MNLAEAANLILTLSLKDEVSSGLRGIQGQLDATDRSQATLQGGLTKIQQGIGVGIRNAALIGVAGIGALTHQVIQGFESLNELEEVTAQTNAVIESTGGIAGITADEVRSYAQELESLTGVDDKVIQSGENVLLTFTNIREEAFRPTLEAALDMSVAMGQDLQSSIVQVGKALNDPVNGLSALTRVGVTFDEESKKIIADMVAMGDTAGAQQLIIQELNREFGGSAQAQMQGYRGSITRLKDAWEEVQITLAQKLAPAVDKIATKFGEFIGSDKFMRGVEDLGDAIADLFSDENIDRGMDIVEDVFGGLRDLPWGAIKDGISGAAQAAKTAVDIFKSLPPGVQTGLITLLAANKLTGGLVATGLGELLKVGLRSLTHIMAGNVTVVGATVTGPGGGFPTPVGAPGGQPGGQPGQPGGRPMPVMFPTPGAVAPLGLAMDEIISRSHLNDVQIQGVLERTAENTQRAVQGISAQEGELITIRNNTAAMPGLTLEQSRELATIRNHAGAIVAPINRMPEQLGELQIIANNTAAAKPLIAQLSTQTVTTHTLLKGLGTQAQAISGGVQGGNQLSQRQIERLQRLQDLQASGNTLNQQQRERLERLQGIAQQTQTKTEAVASNTRIIANKDFSTSVTVRTSLNVSAREVAAAVQRWTNLRGENEFG